MPSCARPAAYPVTEQANRLPPSSDRALRFKIELDGFEPRSCRGAGPGTGRGRPGKSAALASAIVDPRAERTGRTAIRASRIAVYLARSTRCVWFGEVTLSIVILPSGSDTDLSFDEGYFRALESHRNPRAEELGKERERLPPAVRDIPGSTTSSGRSLVIGPQIERRQRAIGHRQP